MTFYCQNRDSNRFISSDSQCLMVLKYPLLPLRPFTLKLLMRSHIPDNHCIPLYQVWVDKLPSDTKGDAEG